MRHVRYLTGLTATAALFCLNAAAQPIEIPSTSTTPSKPDSLVVLQAAELYEEGRLGDAEFLALKALDSPNGLSKRDRAQLFQVLAFCAIANDDEENGKRQFVSALQLNPNLVPDPISWSPKVRRVFEKAREVYAQIIRIQAIESESREADLCRRASLQSLYFPGAGQYMKGAKLKAYTSGTLFWASLAVFAYAESALPDARDRYRNATLPLDIQHSYNDYRTLSRTALMSGSFTAACYVYSFFDALWSDSQQAKALETGQ